MTPYKPNRKAHLSHTLLKCRSQPKECILGETLGKSKVGSYAYDLLSLTWSHARRMTELGRMSLYEVSTVTTVTTERGYQQ